jgi:hypothetical protein
MDLRRTASVVSMVLGAIFIVAGLATIVLVTVELNDEQITIPDDGCLGGWQVRDPITAWCQADIIDQHARDTTDGLTYAQLDREDPRRDMAMNASFLRASLFTSIVAYGVAAMAIAMGAVFILIGLGIRDVHEHLDRLGLARSGTGTDAADREYATAESRPVTGTGTATSTRTDPVTDPATDPTTEPPRDEGRL